MLERLLFVLLGLEPTFWGSVDASERRWFRLLLIIFGINSLVLLIGSITNMYLASSEWGWAIGAGLLLTYVFWNILRFSYLTIRISPSEINQRIQQKAHITAGPLSTTGVQPIDARPLWQKWKASLSQIHEFIGFGRWLLYFFVGLMVMTLSFPISYFLVHSKANALNQEWRRQHLAEWEKSEQANFIRLMQPDQQHLKDLLLKRDSLHAVGFTSSDEYYREMLVKISEQENRIEQRSQEFYVKFKSQKLYLTKQWAHRFFILQLVAFVWQQPSTKAVLVVLSFLFLAPLFMLMHLKTGTSFRYFSESATHFREVILLDHQQTQAEINQILTVKYGQIKGDHWPSIWADEPFNTQYSQQYLPKTEVPISTLG